MDNQATIQPRAGLSDRATKQKPVTKSIEETQLKFCFWRPVIKLNDKDEQYISDVSINYLVFYSLLYELGFRRLDIGDETIFIQITNNRIIKRVTPKLQMQDAINDFISTLPESLTMAGYEFKSVLISAKILMAVNSLWNDLRLTSQLKPKEPIVFNRDSLGVKYMYFNNGYLRISAEAVKFKAYDQLLGYIWDSEILKHDYQAPVNNPDKNYIERFCRAINGKSEKRFESLQTIIGYYLHNYTNYKLKALLLTDSKIDEDGEANGQTGKSLLSKIIGGCISNNPEDPSIKSFVDINGKDFNSKEKHKYSVCDIDSKLIVINDLPKFFDVDSLYNDITEGINVDKKGIQSFKIRVKIIVTTNKTVKIEGISSKARFIEYELTDNYNLVNTPEIEFGHRLFGETWETEDFCRYFQFMAQCCQKFFINKQEIIIPEQINLDYRKLIQNTSIEFLNFMEDLNPDDYDITGKQYEKKDLFNKYITAYGGYVNDKFNQKKFTEFVKNYIKYHKDYGNYDKAKNEFRGNLSVQYFRFIKK